MKQASLKKNIRGCKNVTIFVFTMLLIIIKKFSKFYNSKYTKNLAFKS